MCPVLYGTDEDHFETYGFVTPTDINCLSGDGLAICISDTPNPQDLNPTPKPTIQQSTTEISQPLTTTTEVSNTAVQVISSNTLLCLPIEECQVLYGSDPQHFDAYGFVSPIDKDCSSAEGLALCISSIQNGPQAPTTSPIPAQDTTESLETATQSQTPAALPAIPETIVELPCKPFVDCWALGMEFGSDPRHYEMFGHQNVCPVGQIRCVVNIVPPTTTTSTSKPQETTTPLKPITTTETELLTSSEPSATTTRPTTTSTEPITLGPVTTTANPLPSTTTPKPATAKPVPTTTTPRPTTTPPASTTHVQSSPCSKAIEEWSGGMTGVFNLRSAVSVTSWKAEVTFDSAFDSLNVWNGGSVLCDGVTCSFTNKPWNGFIDAGKTLKLEYLTSFANVQVPPQVVSLILNGAELCVRDVGKPQIPTIPDNAVIPEAATVNPVQKPTATNPSQSTTSPNPTTTRPSTTTTTQKPTTTSYKPTTTTQISTTVDQSKPCAKTIQDWPGGVKGKFNLRSAQTVSTWTVKVIFDSNFNSLNVWNSDQVQCDGVTCSFTNKPWNGYIGAGQNIELEYMATFPYAGVSPQVVSLILNGVELCGIEVEDPQTPATTETINKPELTTYPTTTSPKPSPTTTTPRPSTTRPSPSTTTPRPTTTSPASTTLVNTIGTNDKPQLNIPTTSIDLPCKPFSECWPPNIEFGSSNEHYSQYGPQKPCPVGQIRCVPGNHATTTTTPASTSSTTTSFTTTTLSSTTTTLSSTTITSSPVSSTTEVTAEPLEPVTQPQRPAVLPTIPETIIELPCKPFVDCWAPGMEFGSDPSHYQKFGKQKLCPVGQIRCVANISPPTTSLSTNKPTRNKVELPCKPANECDIPFSPTRHILTYGYQKPCPQVRHKVHFSQDLVVRCVTSKIESSARASLSKSTLPSRNQPTSTTAQLPCKPVSECGVAFNPAIHLASFGFQIPCPEEKVRCVTQVWPLILF